MTEVKELKEKLEKQATKNVILQAQELTELMNKTKRYGVTFSKEYEKELLYLDFLIKYVIGDNSETNMNQMLLQAREYFNDL